MRLAGRRLLAVVVANNLHTLEIAPCSRKGYLQQRVCIADDLPLRQLRHPPFLIEGNTTTSSVPWGPKDYVQYRRLNTYCYSYSNIPQHPILINYLRPLSYFESLEAVYWLLRHPQHPEPSVAMQEPCSYSTTPKL